MKSSSVRFGNLGDGLNTVIHGQHESFVVHAFRVLSSVNTRFGDHNFCDRTSKLLELEADIAPSHSMLLIRYEARNENSPYLHISWLGPELKTHFEQMCEKLATWETWSLPMLLGSLQLGDCIATLNLLHVCRGDIWQS